MAHNDAPKTLFESFKDNVLSSIPAVSVLTFVIVALKVYRAAGMEASTTVAIVTGADLIALLEGVILTLLPSFLALLISAAIWLWADRLDEPTDAEDAKADLVSFDHLAVWTAVAVGFFTLPWPFFVLLLIPFAALVVWLWRRSRGRAPKPERFARARSVLKVMCVIVGGTNVFFLALSPTVWLPLRHIEVVSGQAIELDGEALPSDLGAYVLSEGETEVVLLLDSPRAVVEVAPSVIEPNPPICIPEPARLRELFYLRPVQVLGIEGDTGSPYPRCPQAT